MPGFLGQVREVVKSSPLDWKGRARRECQAAVALFDRSAAGVGGIAGTGRGAGVGGGREDGRARLRIVRRLARADRAADVAVVVSELDGRCAVGTRVGGRRDARPSAGARPLRDHADRRPAARGDRRPRRGHGAARRDGRSPTAVGQRCRSCWPAITLRRRVLRLPRAEVEGLQSSRPTRTTWSPGPTRRCATCRFPPQTREAAPHLYYLLYRSPAPFDPFGTFEYVVPPIDGLTGAELEAPSARYEPQRDHAQPRGPPRRHRPSRAELARLPRSRRASARSRRSTPPAASPCSAAAAWPRAGPATSAT